MTELASRVDALAARARARRAEQRADEQAAAQERAEADDAKRAALRASMPWVASVVDEMRAVFGPGVSVLVAVEGGRVVANRRACALAGLGVEAYVESKT